MPDKVRPTRPTATQPVGMPDGASQPAAGELVVIDPKQLRTGANVRTDLRLTAAFIDSIRQHGVLEAITARRDDSGRLVIQRGHRRAAAAVQAGLAGVRVFVEPGPAAPSADTTAAATRLVTQLVENDHRDGVAPGDRINAYSQLAAFGLKVGDIARTIGAKKGEVDKALAVAGNDLASKATVRYDLTLDEAFAVAEFAGDKDSVKALIAAKKTGQFDHVAQRLRDQRDYDAAETALRAALAERGVKVLESDRGDNGGVRLCHLKHDGRVLDEAGHATCKYRAAHLKATYDERHVTAVEVCTDPLSAGHKPRYGEQLTTAGGPHAGGLTEAQKKHQSAATETAASRREI